MERLAALAEFFQLDNYKNRANIITVVKTDKVSDYEYSRRIIINLATKHPLLKHKLIKLMGKHFLLT